MTTPVERIRSYHAELKALRRDLHAHPELAFEENRTSALVAERLASWGIEVHRGLAKTGVVGVVKGRKSNSEKAVGLRADMDCLPVQEANGFAHKSQHAGRMHACGHDGHTTMLLGAARYLAETRSFDGTAYLIFQPAEEGGGGGHEMVKEGLMERFAISRVFGMHNMPGLPEGHFATTPGAMLASSDNVKITVTGKGGHAGAGPHKAVDSVLIGSQIV
ncbi:MAG TPA: amidohydrolase, partial [Steroidobacteraceae bacterium]